MALMKRRTILHVTPTVQTANKTKTKIFLWLFLNTQFSFEEQYVNGMGISFHTYVRSVVFTENGSGPDVNGNIGSRSSSSFAKENSKTEMSPVKTILSLTVPQFLIVHGDSRRLLCCLMFVFLHSAVAI